LVCLTLYLCLLDILLCLFWMFYLFLFWMFYLCLLDILPLSAGHYSFVCLTFYLCLLDILKTLSAGNSTSFVWTFYMCLLEILTFFARHSTYAGGHSTSVCWTAGHSTSVCWTFWKLCLLDIFRSSAGHPKNSVGVHSTSLCWTFYLCLPDILPLLDILPLSSGHSASVCWAFYFCLLDIGPRMLDTFSYKKMHLPILFPYMHCTLNSLRRLP
jgi:hypothetical protein